MRGLALLFGAAISISPAVAQQAIPLAPPPMVPADTGGIEIVDRSLARLSSHRRLLVVGAHPDDEDTSVLSLVGRGLAGEAAYLSLTRGEGGQNLVGPELDLALGLIRTGELLAARRIEATRQYFTRAYDFGYTRSMGEAFARWPRGELQEDAVRVTRRFKPQVVVAVFPDDARAGHGQHRVAGVLAKDILELAGRPDRFPRLTAEGLPPWQPEVLYRRAWWTPEEATLELRLDAVDPLTGSSVRQIAAASRSMHRSQDMGTLQDLGSATAAFAWVDGQVGADAASADLFGGIDTRLSAISRLLPPGPLRDAVRGELERVAALAAQARAALSPADLGRTAPALAEIVRSLARLVGQVRRTGEEPASRAVIDLLDEKLQVASLGLLAATGIALDAVCDRQGVTAGGSLTVTAMIWNSGSVEAEVESVELISQPGWRVGDRSRLAEKNDSPDVERWQFEVETIEDLVPSLPYFLRRPLDGDMYDWQEASPAVRGEPLETSPLTARFTLQIAGTPVEAHREVVYRFLDQATGEVREPLRAVPPLEVTLQPELLLWPTSTTAPRVIEVILRSNTDRPLRGRLEIRGSEGWPTPPSRSFQIDAPLGTELLRFELPLPDDSSIGRTTLTAVATLDSGERYDAAYPVLGYSHVEPLPMFKPARAEIQLLDLRLPEVGRVGYVRGAADRVPEILRAVGVPLELLTAAELDAGNLSDYDVIVIGSRAYETDPSVGKSNARLLEFVRSGGVLIVQYQQYEFARRSYAPFRLTIGRPHGRVTDEASPVRLLRPDHPVFHRPNRISERDWQGWIQERGLYFASEWDPAFEPLLAVRDDGQPEERGSLLVARLGRGTYVYTGLSFFRELPAGVPGALRLFVNLLALGEP